MTRPAFAAPSTPSPTAGVPASAARPILLAAAIVYLAGFVACPPQVIQVSDEAAYVRQALAFASGRVTAVETDPLTGAERRVVPSQYPVGTSAVQAPFVWLGGWRAAALASVLLLIATLGILARWLTDAGRSPLYALLLLGYAPALVMGRIAMSDVPSGAIVALFLWLFWKGEGRGAGLGFAAGLCGGLSLLFRETNLVLPAVFVAGAVVRRDRNVKWLVAGAACGVAVQLAASGLVFGSPFFLRDPGHGLSLAAIPRNAPLYLLALLVMVPGGLLAGLLYRGPRRAELVTAVVADVLLFLAYDYGGELTGGIKRLVVGPRYFIPLVPLLAWAISDLAPRAVEWMRRRASRPATVSRWVGRAAWAWTAAVLAATALVHPVMDAWGRSQAEVVRALFGHTRDGGPVVTNLIATRRFLVEVYGRRLVVPHHRIAPADVRRLLERHGSVQIAFLDRVDHRVPEGWFHETGPFVEAVVSAGCRVETVYDHDHPGLGVLRVWDVSGCGP